MDPTGRSDEPGSSLTRLIIHFCRKKLLVVVPSTASIKEVKDEILKIHNGVSSSAPGAAVPDPSSLAIVELQNMYGCVLYDDYPVGSVLRDMAEVYAFTEADCISALSTFSSPPAGLFSPMSSYYPWSLSPRAMIPGESWPHPGVDGSGFVLPLPFTMPTYQQGSVSTSATSSTSSPSARDYQGTPSGGVGTPSGPPAFGSRGYDPRGSTPSGDCTTNVYPTQPPLAATPVPPVPPTVPVFPTLTPIWFPESPVPPSTPGIPGRGEGSKQSGGSSGSAGSETDGKKREGVSETDGGDRKPTSRGNTVASDARLIDQSVTCEIKGTCNLSENGGVKENQVTAGGTPILEGATCITAKRSIQRKSSAAPKKKYHKSQARFAAPVLSRGKVGEISDQDVSLADSVRSNHSLRKSTLDVRKASRSFSFQRDVLPDVKKAEKLPVSDGNCSPGNSEAQTEGKDTDVAMTTCVEPAPTSSGTTHEKETNEQQCDNYAACSQELVKVSSGMITSANVMPSCEVRLAKVNVVLDRPGHVPVISSSTGEDSLTRLAHKAETAAVSKKKNATRKKKLSGTYPRANSPASSSSVPGESRHPVLDTSAREESEELIDSDSEIDISDQQPAIHSSSSSTSAAVGSNLSLYAQPFSIPSATCEVSPSEAVGDIGAQNQADKPLTTEQSDSADKATRMTKRQDGPTRKEAEHCPITDPVSQRKAKCLETMSPTLSSRSTRPLRKSAMKSPYFYPDSQENQESDGSFKIDVSKSLVVEEATGLTEVLETLLKQSQVQIQVTEDVFKPPGTHLCPLHPQTMLSPTTCSSREVDTEAPAPPKPKQTSPATSRRHAVTVKDSRMKDVQLVTTNATTFEAVQLGKSPKAQSTRRSKAGTSALGKNGSRWKRQVPSDPVSLRVEPSIVFSSASSSPCDHFSENEKTNAATAQGGRAPQNIGVVGVPERLLLSLKGGVKKPTRIGNDFAPSEAEQLEIYGDPENLADTLSHVYQSNLQSLGVRLFHDTSEEGDESSGKDSISPVAVAVDTHDHERSTVEPIRPQEHVVVSKTAAKHQLRKNTPHGLVRGSDGTNMTVLKLSDKQLKIGFREEGKQEDGVGHSSEEILAMETQDPEDFVTVPETQPLENEIVLEIGESVSEGDDVIRSPEIPLTQSFQKEGRARAVFILGVGKEGASCDEDVATGVLQSKGLVEDVDQCPQVQSAEDPLCSEATVLDTDQDGNYTIPNHGSSSKREKRKRNKSAMAKRTSNVSTSGNEGEDVIIDVVGSCEDDQVMLLRKLKKKGKRRKKVKPSRESSEQLGSSIEAREDKVTKSATGGRKKSRKDAEMSVLSTENTDVDLHTETLVQLGKAGRRKKRSKSKLKSKSSKGSETSKEFCHVEVMPDPEPETSSLVAERNKMETEESEDEIGQTKSPQIPCGDVKEQRKLGTKGENGVPGKSSSKLVETSSEEETNVGSLQAGKQAEPVLLTATARNRAAASETSSESESGADAEADEVKSSSAVQSIGIMLPKGSDRSGTDYILKPNLTGDNRSDGRRTALPSVLKEGAPSSTDTSSDTDSSSPEEEDERVVGRGLGTALGAVGQKKPIKRSSLAALVEVGKKNRPFRPSKSSSTSNKLAVPQQRCQRRFSTEASRKLFSLKRAPRGKLSLSTPFRRKRPLPSSMATSTPQLTKKPRTNKGSKVQGFQHTDLSHEELEFSKNASQNLSNLLVDEHLWEKE